MTVRTLGKQFQNLSINGKEQSISILIAPEANPNGIILRSLYASAVTVVVGKTKPAIASDLGYVRIPQDQVLYNDLLIPAGNGLYSYNTSQYDVRVYMSWDVLNADGTVV